MRQGILNPLSMGCAIGAVLGVLLNAATGDVPATQKLVTGVLVLLFLVCLIRSRRRTA